MQGAEEPGTKNSKQQQSQDNTVLPFSLHIALFWVGPVASCCRFLLHTPAHNVTCEYSPHYNEWTESTIFYSANFLPYFSQKLMSSSFVWSMILQRMYRLLDSGGWSEMVRFLGPYLIQRRGRVECRIGLWKGQDLWLRFWYWMAQYTFSLIETPY